jgi:UDP-N-acetyl-D-glucosamine/UDP-N-acetyl-D-galactosamine dehydrogenase
MRHIAVIGLGYVGLPVALALADKFPLVVGYDRDESKVDNLRRGLDSTAQFSVQEITASSLRITSSPAEIAAADFYIVAVPTPIDEAKKPDLRALRAAAELVAAVLKIGDIVSFESTVYPGVTEDICGPILEAGSSLRQGVDFHLAYSPERINPGDPEHTLDRVVKVISADSEEALDIVAAVYGEVASAGLHRAPSIQVAEAAKVIENVQRDLNIALMNELAIIFDALGLDTLAVLEAAATKWNFHAYTPGLVGGHCIGVDPYYLTTRAEEAGLTPKVILAGRETNDGMGAFVAAKLIKHLLKSGVSVRGARVAILGLAFKPNVPDLRNSQVPAIIEELVDFGASVLVHDPRVDAAEARTTYGIELTPACDLTNIDAVLLAIPHDGLADLARALCLSGAGILVDVMGVVTPAPAVPTIYWRL